MGCGVSRLDGNGIVLPPKLRPVFLYRLEEIKMRRHTRPLKDSSSTPSKKELLLHDDRDEDDNASTSYKNAYKIMPLSPQDSVSQVKKFEDQKGKEPGKQSKEEASGKNEERDDRKHEAVKDRSSRENGGKNDEKESKIGDVKSKEEAEIEGTLTDADNDNDDKEDEDERMIGHDDVGAFPGSPSFRVYFTDNVEDKHNDIGKNDAFKNTISSFDDTESSKESSENKKVKRGRKKKSFRRVLPKGGQAAVKNLLSVTSCYAKSPSAHDHAHLLTGKTTA
ncbi:hypothetical protein Pfo_020251 [Paulownia fortunei]|nr:hypothetical protein Pfo_020251 [Paulownia fortunei]